MQTQVKAFDRAHVRRRPAFSDAQRPDIIMIGEIRDLETAIIATEAALTGHLVLSTVHTNDAPHGHAPREMGVAP